MERLAGLVRDASKIGILKGVRVGHKNVEVRLLLFADDTLFFCQPHLHYVLAIKAILRCFELVSGLKVNFHKSTTGTIGLCEVDSVVFSKCLNSGRMNLPFNYLGMTIGGNPRRVSFWKPIIEKISNRLSSWKGKILSMVGKICLLKSVISALPPTDVCNCIRKIQAKFLSVWGHEGRKIA